MRAVHLNDYGPIENIEVVDIPSPKAGPGEVLIRVAYAGLRWGDIMQRNGWPSRGRPTPYVLGQEASGVIEAVGEGVKGFAVGQRVVSTPLQGGFAEYLAAPAGVVTVLDDNTPLDRCLAYPVNMRTAHLMIYAWAKVQEGETVLLHTAAGGVGLMALQILKRRFKDVKVIGIVGSEEKANLVRAHGCDHVINRRTQDYVAEVIRITGPKATGFAVGGARGGGVDVALNAVSGPTLATDPQVIRKRGRWVIYGYIGGRALIDTSPFGYDGITIMPFSSIAWRGTPEDMAARDFTTEWMANEPLLEPQVYPLEQVAKAEADLESGRTSGKVVFKI